MFGTTMEAMRALLKADASLTPTDRARILTSIRNHGKESETPRAVAVAETCIFTRTEVARRFNRSLRFVDDLAKAGALHRIRMPGRKRGCGFASEEVERLMAGEEV